MILRRAVVGGVVAVALVGVSVSSASASGHRRMPGRSVAQRSAAALAVTDGLCGHFVAGAPAWSWAWSRGYCAGDMHTPYGADGLATRRTAAWWTCVDRGHSERLCTYVYGQPGGE